MNGAPYASNAAGFLIQTLFGVYILFVMLRFLLQWVRADFYNPLVQFLVRVTDPPLLPLRRVIPGFWGLDMAAVVLMLVLQIVEILLLQATGAYYPYVLGIGPGDYSLNLAALLVLAVVELLRLLVNVFLWAVVIQAILSWVAPGSRHPAALLLYQLTAPLLRPARRLVPVVSGIDFSPMVVIVVLILIKMLLLDPLWDMGRYLALS